MFLVKAIHINGYHINTTSRNPSCTEWITKGIIGNFIAQTTATCQGVGVVRLIYKEGIALTEFFSTEARKMLVVHVFVFGEHRSSNHREGEDCFGALDVEPMHKELLKFV